MLHSHHQQQLHSSLNSSISSHAEPTGAGVTSIADSVLVSVMTNPDHHVIPGTLTGLLSEVIWCNFCDTATLAGVRIKKVA